MCEVNIPTVWVDKDGVLAQYDYSIFEPENGAPAPWLIRNAHVFKNLEPYPNMVTAISRLYKECMSLSMYKRKMTIKVLTSVSDGLTLSEHVIDGAEWCEKYLGLRKRDFYATATPKESIPINLRSKITHMDILLDDYMPNLIKWKEAGGTAVKVINDINSTTDKFPFFYNHVDPDYIVCVIYKIVDTIMSGKELETGQIAPMADQLSAYKKERGK